MMASEIGPQLTPGSRYFCIHSTLLSNVGGTCWSYDHRYGHGQHRRGTLGLHNDQASTQHHSSTAHSRDPTGEPIRSIIYRLEARRLHTNCHIMLHIDTTIHSATRAAEESMEGAGRWTDTHARVMKPGEPRNFSACQSCVHGGLESLQGLFVCLSACLCCQRHQVSVQEG